MTPIQSFDDGKAILATRTGMSTEEWEDYFSCSMEQQALIAKTAEHMRWTQNRDTLADALAILGVLMTFAGAASGVGSAVMVLKAL